jgi:hypothetical protein
MNLDLHIERLVIDGEVAPGEVPGIRRDLKRELTRLLRDGGLSHELRDGAALPSVRGGSIGHNPDRAPLGSRLARAVYEGIGDRKWRAGAVGPSRRTTKG